MSSKFENLKAWQASRELAVYCYKLTKNFPKSETFSLTNQILRSAISISANIAEGCSRSSKRDFRRFLEIALGSSFELETFMVISYDIGYIDLATKVEADNRIQKCEKLINGLKRSLENV